MRQEGRTRLIADIAALDGKTAIITGANRGIGFATAMDLAKRGMRVILACRDLESANLARDLIEKESQNEEVFAKRLDLASFESIRKFAAGINETEQRLDVLINNAGLLANSYRTTEDGYELHFGINHLGHFLLTNLLLDLLKRSAPSRVVHVSSIAHRTGIIHWDDPNMKTCFNSVYAYSQSKLMNVLFSLELSKRLSGSGVTSNSLHPGAINTDIYRESNGCCKLGGCVGFWISIVAMLRNCMSTPKKGAQTVIYCAVAPELESVSGRYFRNCEITREARKAQDEDAAQKLWNLSEQLTQI